MQYNEKMLDKGSGEMVKGGASLPHFLFTGIQVPSAISCRYR